MRGNNSLPAFLLALRQSIVKAGVVAENCTQIVTEERTLEYSQGEYLCMVIPGPMRPEDQGGNNAEETIFAGTITFRLLCQTALDTAISDVVALTDDATTTGIYVLMQRLLKVIRYWDECDASGNTYLIQPMRLSSSISQPRRNEKHENYVQLDVTAEYKICIGEGVSGR